MRRCKRVLAATIITSLAVGAVGCGSTGAADGDGSAVTIAHIAQLTGAAEQNGIQFQGGVEAALDELDAVELPGGIDVRVEVHDDGTEIDRAAQLLSTVTSEDVDAVFSSGWTPIATALWPLANRAETPLIAGATLGGAEHSADYFFSLLDLPGPHAAVGEHLAKPSGARRVGLVIDGDNPGFELLADPLEDGLKAKGLEGYVTTQTISTGDADYSAVLSNLAAADVDAIAAMISPGDVGNLIVQARRAPGLEDVVFATHHSVSGQVAEVAGDDAVGTTFPQSWVMTDEAAAAAYQAEHGVQPTSYFAYGHDATWIVAVAASIAAEDGVEINGEAIRDRIPAATESDLFAEQRLVDGLTLTADGQPSITGVLATFDNDGRVVPVG
ncbi:hypothetical protein ADL00_34720 [Streptomyces sp. AS58]|nr:hypothetical protein ADL00_34720 [Streptomyces sp. AS58]